MSNPKELAERERAFSNCTLQFRWSDEPDNWRTLYVGTHNKCQLMQKEYEVMAETIDRRYPHHTFKPEFRIT